MDQRPPLGRAVEEKTSSALIAVAAVVALVVGLVAGVLIGALLLDDDDVAEPAVTTTTVAPDSSTPDAEASPCVDALSRAERALDDVGEAADAVRDLDGERLSSAIEVLDDTADTLSAAVEQCRSAVGR